MTAGRGAWAEPEDGYIDVPSLPPSSSILQEELDDIAERSYGGQLQSEKREQYAQALSRHYEPGAPLREFLGFAFLSEDVDEFGWANTPRTYVRVMARSGFEARKAVLAHLGEEFKTSIWNREEQRRRR